uniref:Uncharacterized protein n=1 Tax=Siphoviridae sp. ctnPP24 TaxID=2825662 RepID=A0A8S5TZ80_9CAUD|nr:MAG TPA: hypothetical protein [Siphoviridae sp. ctnPP24]
MSINCSSHIYIMICKIKFCELRKTPIRCYYKFKTKE